MKRYSVTLIPQCTDRHVLFRFRSTMPDGSVDIRYKDVLVHAGQFVVGVEAMDEECVIMPVDAVRVVDIT